MKDGIYSTFVHGWLSIIKIVDGKPHLLDKKKWILTVIDPERLKKYKSLSEEEMIAKLLESDRLQVINN